jgi:hypothetical protein
MSFPDSGPSTGKQNKGEAILPIPYIFEHFGMISAYKLRM